MKVSKIEVGELQCNCYLIENSKECLLIDPGDELSKIKNFIEGKNIRSILITHNHFDHIGCVKKLQEEYHLEVYDANNLKEGFFQIGSFSFEVINTKGHSQDSITFYFKKEKVMFTGDFLFFNTIGRCDLEGGSQKEMLNSMEKIKKYQDDIIVYPGHGPSTILGREKQYNPYFHSNHW